ncbi:molybdenum cofactor guanylyltransferase MobA [Kaistia geumhonensis]|uniref:Molybdenum cofactor guanylyltransferase n=1 Tax=Kaistia geumhonensis TaxID=410839 RepID=A0ABU0M1Q0_9HYPH|nr:molybdenum cofactor guanylyltransferase MobA [Kaistia geumhonensis]MCX5479894.1 molybdenum cofactor guanylyltransferase MobA [Kaistia geumhonensis]MDQ0514879.1 molybdopterin-guanine dinucleotide biosynthesis protein A [Kaistia geumhonensis]
MTDETIAGIILAGGTSRRMGSDKAFVTLGGRPLVAHAVDRLSRQVGPLAINANVEPERFGRFRLPIVADDSPDTGPLGGVLAGLRWATDHPQAPRHLVTVPVDGPFIPSDLVARLREAASASGTVAIAASGDRDHPVFALWPVQMADRLADWRLTAKSHGVRAFLAATGFAVATWPLPAIGPDPFFNANTPDDLARAEAWLAGDAAL